MKTLVDVLITFFGFHKTHAENVSRRIGLLNSADPGIPYAQMNIFFAFLLCRNIIIPSGLKSDQFDVYWEEVRPGVRIEANKIMGCYPVSADQIIRITRILLTARMQGSDNFWTLDRLYRYISDTKDVPMFVFDTLFGCLSNFESGAFQSNENIIIQKTRLIDKINEKLDEIKYSDQDVSKDVEVLTDEARVIVVNNIATAIMTHSGICSLAFNGNVSNIKFPHGDEQIRVFAHEIVFESALKKDFVRALIEVMFGGKAESIPEPEAPGLEMIRYF